MNIYDQIVNPLTGRRVNINGKIGQNVLRNYMQVLNNEQLGGKKISDTDKDNKKPKANKSRTKYKSYTETGPKRYVYGKDE